MGSSQQRAAKWGGWPAVVGLEPIILKSERYDLIHLTTADKGTVATPIISSRSPVQVLAGPNVA